MHTITKRRGRGTGTGAPIRFSEKSQALGRGRGGVSHLNGEELSSQKGQQVQRPQKEAWWRDRGRARGPGG